jgi:hypothetical protein
LHDPRPRYGTVLNRRSFSWSFRSGARASDSIREESVSYDVWKCWCAVPLDIIILLVAVDVRCGRWRGEWRQHIVCGEQVLNLRHIYLVWSDSVKSIK